MSTGIPIAGKNSAFRLRMAQSSLHEPYIIYGLCCPLTGALRYIGITNNLARRMREHMAYRQGTQNKRDWLDELDEQGLAPLVVILDTALDKTRAEWKELRYMYHHAQRGTPLTNSEIVWNTQWLLDLQNDQETNWLADFETMPHIRRRYELFDVNVKYWLMSEQEKARHFQESVYQQNLRRNASLRKRDTATILRAVFAMRPEQTFPLQLVELIRGKKRCHKVRAIRIGGMLR